MKKSIYALVLASFLFSCGGDDDPVATHEVGEWELDSYILTNVPSDYSFNEGRIFAVNEISFGGIVFESYEVTFNVDKTYARTVGVTGPDIKDNGTWELDGDDLTLSSEDFDDDEEYEVERNEDDQLWWSVSSQFSLLEDAIADTITQEYIDSITDEEFFALFDPVTVDLVYAFERK
ncbi:MAG: hypothetical protein AAF391_04715 [Bacteroidota bacterium]